MRARVRVSARVLGPVATAGPVLFTLTWALLGLSHARYLPRQETISSLSAHDVDRWGWMVAGQLALACGFAAVAVLLRRELGPPGTVPAVFAWLAAYGTVQLSAFRTICNHSDQTWCTPLPHSAYPRSQWLHGIGTGLAFGAVLLACLTTVWAAARVVPPLRDVVVVSAVAFTIALPHVVWFLLNAESSWHGFAEKVFLLALTGWVAWCGWRLPRVQA